MATDPTKIEVVKVFTKQNNFNEVQSVMELSVTTGGRLLHQVGGSIPNGQHRHKKSSGYYCKRSRIISRSCVPTIIHSVSDLASHYENLPMQYTEIFEVVKNENFH